MTSVKYRPEIDGLRAVAVLAVLFFHVGFSWMPGGFVGVDVFFVISGYLITTKLWGELSEAGSIDFLRFYSGRMKRLFPALYVTVAGSFIAGYLILPPELMQELAHSVISSLLSVSNIFFWRHSGYFDPSNQSRALLHTWSLSLEEQFYLLWPLVLLSIFRWRTKIKPIVAICLIAATSLSLSIIFQRHSAANYFLLPFRVFELGIGATLVWVENLKPVSAKLDAAMLTLGLVMIVGSSLVFTSNTVFPGYNALVPCVGAWLVIMAGRPRYLARVLTNKVATSLGSISYSLYLVHWPVIVFWSYRAGSVLSSAEKITICLVTICVATFLYAAVENPIRRGRVFGNRPFPQKAVGIAISCALAIGPAWDAAAHAGWPWRYPLDVQRLMDQTGTEIGIKPYPRGCFMAPPTNYKDIPPACYTAIKGEKNILLLGDSTAFHLLAGLYTLIGNDTNILVYTSSSCPPITERDIVANSSCRDTMEYFFSEILPKNRYDLVIAADAVNWADMSARFPESQARIRATGSELVLVGPTVMYKDKTINLVGRTLYLGSVDAAIRSGIEVGCTGERGMDKLVPTDRYFSMMQRLCTSDGMPIYELNGKLINLDHLHLNGMGSLYIGRQLVAFLKEHALL